MTHPTPQGQLSREQIEALAARHLGEMHVENCGIGDIVGLARAIEQAAAEVRSLSPASMAPTGEVKL